MAPKATKAPESINGAQGSEDSNVTVTHDVTSKTTNDTTVPSNGLGDVNLVVKDVKASTKEKLKPSTNEKKRGRTTSGLDIFQNDDRIPKKDTSRRRRRVVYSDSSSSGSSSSSSSDSSDDDSDSSCDSRRNVKRRRSNTKRTDNHERVDLLARGEAPFVGDGKIYKEMKKTAKSQKRKWEQLSLKNSNRMLSSLESDLTRRRRVDAAANVESVRSVVEHLYLASCESPSITPMCEEANKDVLNVALNHTRGSQGCPVLWSVVTKHVINKVADLTQRIEACERPRGASSSSSSSSKSSSASTSTFNHHNNNNNKKDWKKPDGTKRLCRNCLVSHPSQRSLHTIKECQRAGNTCQIECTLCGIGKHWEDQCSRKSYTN